MSTKFCFFMMVFLIISQGFFAMFEMAAVSFNKIRLQYYVKQKKRAAILLSKLISQPSKLFGTSLIMINTCLQFGSEYSRLFYKSLNLNPDLSPISQVCLVLLFAELCPMFAARRHPHRIALFCVPFVYLVSLLLLPITYFVMCINMLLNFLFGKGKSKTSLFLSKAELKRAFEGQSSNYEKGQKILSQLFTLKDQSAKDVMKPSDFFKLLKHDSSIGDMAENLKKNYSDFVLLYHKNFNNIIGVIESKDILLLNNSARCIKHSKSPWFIDQKSKAIDILHQFKNNNRTCAVVTDNSGTSIGIVTLSMLLDHLLHGTISEDKNSGIYFEQTIPAGMTLSEFNDRFHSHIDAEHSSIGNHIAYLLNHTPKEDDKVVVENLELTVSRATILGAEELTVKTKF